MSSSCLKTITLLISFFVLFLFSSSISYSSHQCGNGVCQPDGHHAETCSSCSSDCGACEAPTSAPPAATPTTAPDSSSEDSGSSGSSGSSNSSSSSTPQVVYYPSVAINAYSPNPTNKQSITLSGSASVTNGSISAVEYSTNGTVWNSASINGGSYTFPLHLSEGIYRIQARAKSTAGVYTKSENYAATTITIATTPPKTTLAKLTSPTKEQSPVINVSASSQFASITSVEISLNDGKTWNKAQKTGVNFSYIPKKLEDGNYKVIARAFDNAGNIGKSSMQTLVIDTIPPIIGGINVGIGLQTITPNRDGSIKTVVGVPIILQVNMKGGPTEAELLYGNQKNTFKQLPGTHLWTTTVTFSESREIQLKIVAIDGADNTTERVLNTFIAEEQGQVSDGSVSISDAIISVYYSDSVNKNWVLWQAESFGQKNPQQTDALGNYSFILPTGKYYIETKAPGFVPAQSEIFSLVQTTSINTNVVLKKGINTSIEIPVIGRIGLHLDFLIPPTTYQVNQSSSQNAKNTYSLSNGAKAPVIRLPDNKSFPLANKKTVISFFATWSPLSLEQVPILNSTFKALPDNQTIIGVALQESASAIETFMKRGNYTFPVIADPNGHNSNTYKITVLPQHFFISSTGQIEEIYTGVLKKEALLEKLGKLP